MTAVLAFFAGPIGRWIVVAVLLLGAAFTAAMYERNVQYKKDLAAFDLERQAQAQADLRASALLDAKYRKKEADDKLAKAKIGDDYAAYRRTHRTRTDSDQLAASNGSLRLSVLTHCPNAAGGSATATSRPAPGGNGPGTLTDLPAETTGRLFALANDADAIVAQLTACQAVVASDRGLVVPQQPKGVP